MNKLSTFRELEYAKQEAEHLKRRMPFRVWGGWFVVKEGVGAINCAPNQQLFNLFYRVTPPKLEQAGVYVTKI